MDSRILIFFSLLILKDSSEHGQIRISRPVNLHPLLLSGRPDISLGPGTFKNQVQNMDLKKQRAKNRIIVIQKVKRHFTLLFSGPYFGSDIYLIHTVFQIFHMENQDNQLLVLQLLSIISSSN